ncbi:MAG: outer membrane beta-barrel protein [Bacteroidetes bacterium]|nr:outer membrane beta-barrel protein [Bacteroidota bacterium]
MKPNQGLILFFTLMIFTGINLLQAQQYQAAGYILLQHDTINGKIVQTSDQQSHHKCIFITDSGIEKAYTPDQISGWGIDQLMHFRSVNTSQEGTADLQFAQVILAGYSDLLRYTDQRGFYRYLLCLPGEACHEITDPKAPGDESKAKGRLIYLLGDDELLRKQIYNQPFIEENLIGHIEYFNTSMQDDKGVRLSSTKKQTTYHFGLKAGYGLSTLSYVASNSHNLGVKYEISTTPFIAPYLEVAFHSPAEKFALRLEINYQTHEYQNEDVQIGMNTLRIPFLLIFKPLPTLRNLGLIIGPYMENVLSVKQSGAYLSNPIQELILTDEKLIEIPDKPFGFGASAGVEYLQPLSKRLSLAFSFSYAYSWNHTDFRYYAVKKKSKYNVWTNTMINNQKSFLDFAIGIRF